MVDPSYTVSPTVGATVGGGMRLEAETESNRRRKSYVQGLLLLLVVVVLWTASNFLTNAVLTTGGYDKPFFVTYANTSSFALYLVPYVFNRTLRGRWVRAQASNTTRYSPLSRDVEAVVLEEEAEAEAEELPKWLKSLGFDVPSVSGEAEAEAEGRVVEAAAIKSYVGLVEDAQRGRGGFERSHQALLHKPIRLTRSLSQSVHCEDSSSVSTPLLSSPSSVSRATSPVRPFLVSTSVARPSSIDGRRPRTSISIVRAGSEGVGVGESMVEVVLAPLTLRQTVVLASQFTLVWFGANWAINAGLGLTSVASGTTIGSASGFFTLALGAALGVDRFTLPRLGAVGISALGVAAVTFADRDTTTSTINSNASVLDALSTRDSMASPSVSAAVLASKPPNAPMGDMLALLSAFLYSLYVMLLKTRIGSEDRISMPLMFGIVGAINILFLWPFLPLLHYTKLEPFSLPSTPQIWLGVALNMAITFVSDFIYLLAMLKSSPLITTLGLSLTIPLAVVIDALKGSHTGGVLAVVGSTAVLSSFGFIGWDDHRCFQSDKLAHQALAHKCALEPPHVRARRTCGADHVDSSISLRSHASSVAST